MTAMLILWVYLSIGSGIWIVLDQLGVIASSFTAHNSEPKGLVLASLMLIVGWPVFVVCWVKGMWA